MTRKWLTNREQRTLKAERDVEPNQINDLLLRYVLESDFTWSNLLSKPTTVAGFGISDAVTTSGNQSIGGQKTFTDFLTCTSYMQSTGALSGYQWFDRTLTTRSWVWYATGGVCYLFSGLLGQNLLSMDDTNRILGDFYGRVRSVPTTTQNANYTFTVQDIGRCRAKTDTTARTYTVDNSIFSAGDVLTVLNDNSTANITIAQGAGVTLYLAGTTTTGNRTVAPRGLATIFMASASVGYVSGPGVT
jgi:hypothetical protein